MTKKKTINDITPEEWDQLASQEDVWCNPSGYNKQGDPWDTPDGTTQYDLGAEILARKKPLNGFVSRDGKTIWISDEEDSKPGIKYDSDKERLDLIPSEMLYGLAAALTYGTYKYGDNNWRRGLNYSRVLGATLRHLTAWAGGVNIDEESGLNHIDQAMLNLGFLVTFEREGRGKQLDDIYGRRKK